MHSSPLASSVFLHESETRACETAAPALRGTFRQKPMFVRHDFTMNSHGKTVIAHCGHTLGVGWWYVLNVGKPWLYS